ncbi:MAG: metallophosphoesterase [Eubacteriales bacterium]|nr:metallophosphoesterase [Eubacteriales bacterium]
MKTFRKKTYEIKTEKLKGNREVKFVIMTDLHGVEFGTDNQKLYDAVMEEEPDAVLVLGDMFVRSDFSTASPAEKLLLKLSEHLTIYYALGNHEFALLENEYFRDAYLQYERRLTSAGVCFLHNEHTCMEIKGTDFVFYGLEIPMEFYRKPKSPVLSLTEMESLIGIPHMEGIHVLLAHNPKYANTYFSWGADLIFCGHYHGGVVRLSEHCGLTCPQFLLFPPYCCGDFHEGGSHMIVSAGLGEHTIPLRIHNPRELISVVLKPAA